MSKAHDRYVMWEGKGRYRDEIKDDLEREHPEGYWWLNANANWEFCIPNNKESDSE